MPNHGVFVRQAATSVSTPNVAECGIPFVIGTAPVQSADNPAGAGVPVLCTSWAEAVEKLGYSNDWSKYSICEMMYAHFKMFGCQPIICCNLLDPAKMSEAVAAADVDVVNHQVKLSIDTIDDASLVVKAAGGTGAAYTKGTDYTVDYVDESMVIELLSGCAGYSAAKVNIAYKKITTASVNAAAIVAGLENIELCMTTLGIVPDLICAPGFSDQSTVAAAMAVKAEGINGMFKAKAVVDISANSYTAAITAKNSGAYTDAHIVCWPYGKLGDLMFHASTLAVGRIAATDVSNGSIPYESPSNKSLPIDSLCLSDGSEVRMTLAQANALNAAGIVTSINFMGGHVLWGNYTGCYPASTDVKDYFIPVSRMFGWVGNSLIKSFWAKLDKPMNRRLIDSILDSANIWLNGLVGQGYLLGARVEMLESENPVTNLMAGIIKLHVYMTPPSPAQEIDFVLEYDADYVSAALQG